MYFAESLSTIDKNDLSHCTNPCAIQFCKHNRKFRINIKYLRKTTIRKYLYIDILFTLVFEFEYFITGHKSIENINIVFLCTLKRFDISLHFFNRKKDILQGKIKHYKYT